MTVRQVLRRYVPYEARLQLRLARRRLADFRHQPHFATNRGDRSGFPVEVCSYERRFIDYPGQESLGKAKRRNQAILANALNETVIAPGETFSVWNLAARPTAEAGYAHAAALKNGELTTDIGGAICLLSTVLYNVALLGGLRIVERHCHSVDSYGEQRYFELGRDAAIEYGYRDLRFVNQHRLPVCLEVTVDAARVRAGLRAPSSLGVEVRLEVSAPAYSELPPVIWFDETLPPDAEVVGTPAIPGLRVSTVRIVRAGDGSEVREDLGETVHIPRPAVIRRGPAAAPGVAG